MTKPHAWADLPFEFDIYGSPCAAKREFTTHVSVLLFVTLLCAGSIIRLNVESLSGAVGDIRPIVIFICHENNPSLQRKK